MMSCAKCSSVVGISVRINILCQEKRRERWKSYQFREFPDNIPYTREKIYLTGHSRG